MIFPNVWNRVVEWFQDRSERQNLVRSFNLSARNAFINGEAPTMLQASVSKGCRGYKHQFSAWLNTGFRIKALSGRALTRAEQEVIGKVIINNVELVRRLVALGWDTLEVCDDEGLYGLRYKLIDYANIGLMLGE